MIPQPDPSPTLSVRATRQRKPRTDPNYVYDDAASAIASSSWSSALPSASSTLFPYAQNASTDVTAQPLASTSKRRRSISSTSPDSQLRKRSRGKRGKTGDEKKLDEELEEAAAEEAFLEAIAEEAEEDDGAKESSDTEYAPGLDATDEEWTAPKKHRRTGRGVKANRRGGKKGKGVGGEKPDAPFVHSLSSCSPSRRRVVIRRPSPAVRPQPDAPSSPQQRCPNRRTASP